MDEAFLLRLDANPELVVNEHEILGSGSCGRVVAGTFCGMRVALKELLLLDPAVGLNAEQREQVRQRLFQEGAFLRTLAHPHVVGFVGVTVDAAGRPRHLVMHREHSSLQRRLQDQPPGAQPNTRAPLPTAELLRIARGVCKALSFLHSRLVLHRDIKLANILLTKQGKVKLCDFGEACPLYRTDHGTYGTLSPGGNMCYAAPEVAAEDRRCEPASDVYCLGVVLMQMATGREPAFTHNQRLSRTADVPGDELRALVRACLAKDPARRPSAADVLARLRALSPPPSTPPPASTHTTHSTSTPASRTPPSPSRADATEARSATVGSRTTACDLEADKLGPETINAYLVAAKRQSDILNSDLEAEKRRSETLSADLEAEKLRGETLNAELAVVRSELAQLRAQIESEAFVRWQPHVLQPMVLALAAALPAGVRRSVDRSSPLWRFAENMMRSRGFLFPTPTPVAGFVISAVDVVALTQEQRIAYEQRQRILQNSRVLSGAHFNSVTSNMDAEQLRVLSALRELFHERPPDKPAEFPNTLYVFHGTRVGLVDVVCTNGLVAVRATDQGFFGCGCYTTPSIEYAARYACGDFDKEDALRDANSDGAYPVVMFVASVGMAYPVTRIDYHKAKFPNSDFFGAPLRPGFDAHVCCVNERAGLQAVSRHDAQYVELVVDQEVQLIPVAVLWLRLS